MNRAQTSHNRQCSKQWQQVSNAPWLTKETLKIVHLLLMSYHNAFNKYLITTPKSFVSELDKAEMLFNLQKPVIAHDTAKDPCLNYANHAALALWRMSWNDMIGMPSRLTAPEEERTQRNHALCQVTKTDPIKSYQGIRINSKGERFMIRNAFIWTLADDDGHTWGQAATFDWWQRI